MTKQQQFYYMVRYLRTVLGYSKNQTESIMYHCENWQKEDIAMTGLTEIIDKIRSSK